MSEKILVTGSKSKIATKLIKLIPNKNMVKSINSKNIDFSTLKGVKEKKKFFLKFDKIFFFIRKLVQKELILRI